MDGRDEGVGEIIMHYIRLALLLHSCYAGQTHTDAGNDTEIFGESLVRRLTV